jgi:outer membrane lipoprotein-sorting protein
MQSIILALLISISVNTQSVTELMQLSQERTRSGNSEMQSTISIYDNRGNQRIREISTFTRQTPESSQLLIRFTSPAEVRGTTLLVYDYTDQADQQWIYLPATGKVRQLISSEKGRNFMGSEFTNSDMSQLNLNDYTFTDAGKEIMDGISCRKIEAKGRTSTLQNEQGYSRKVIYLDEKRLIPIRERFYDRNGKPHRELVYEDYRKSSDGKWVAWQMTMTNLQNGRKSMMQVNKFISELQHSPQIFSPTSLGK